MRVYESHADDVLYVPHDNGGVESPAGDHSAAVVRLSRGCCTRVQRGSAEEPGEIGDGGVGAGTLTEVVVVYGK